MPELACCAPASPRAVQAHRHRCVVGRQLTLGRKADWLCLGDGAPLCKSRQQAVQVPNVSADSLSRAAPSAVMLLAATKLCVMSARIDASPDLGTAGNCTLAGRARGLHIVR